MKSSRLMQACLLALLVTGIASCAVSPEVQAKIDEYARTIPTCNSELDCQLKWTAARAWTVENSDFPLRTVSEDRIFASNTIISTSGMGVIVDKVALDGGGYQFTVDLECFSAYGCPNIWDSKISFNQALNATQR